MRSARSLATLSVLGLSLAIVRPAAAACVQTAGTVTCSGTSSTGFGTGVETNLNLTVLPDASITIGNGRTAINLGSSNSATNNGAIAIGANSAAMSVSGDNNALVNAGTISSTGSNSTGINVLGTGNTTANSGTMNLTGAGSYGIFDFGSGNTSINTGSITIGSSAGTFGTGVVVGTGSTFINSGTIIAASSIGAGVDLFGDGNTVINKGTITATSSFGTALLIDSNNNIAVNNGLLKGGVNGYSLLSFGSSGNSITNTGTMDGKIFFPSVSNTLINSGLITITDPGTALVAPNFGFGGAFTQTAQGTLALRVDNAGNADGLGASEGMKLAGTLRAVVQTGLYQTTTTYGGVLQSVVPVSGQFDNVTTSSVFFTAAATYNSNSVDVTLTRQGFGAVAGETQNQRAVGNALEAGYSPSLTGTAAAFYGQLLAAGSLGVLDKISGEGTSGTQNTAFAAGDMFGQTMGGQMDSWRTGHRGDAGNGGALGYATERPVTSAFNALKAPPRVESQWHVWASGFGAGQALSGDAATGSAGFSDRIAGGAAGVNRLVNPDLLVGVAAGGSSATFNVDDRATSGRLNGAHVGAYAMQRLGAAYVSAQLAYSHFNNATTRTIAGLGATEIARGSFGSDQLGGRIEIGRSHDLGAVTATPFAALQAARLWQAGYTESSVTGAGPGVLGLSYAARGVSSLPAFLGSKFESRFNVGNGMVWMPFGSLAWVHEFSPTRDVTSTLVSMPVAAFTVEGARAAGDTGRVELGSRLVLNSWSQLSARFTGEFSNAGQSYAGTGSLRMSW